MEYFAVNQIYKSLRKTSLSEPQDNVIATGQQHRDDGSLLTMAGTAVCFLLSMIAVSIVAVVVASIGNSLTKETDIITSLISPITFFILKAVDVIGIQQ